MWTYKVVCKHTYSMIFFNVKVAYSTTSKPCNVAGEVLSARKALSVRKGGPPGLVLSAPASLRNNAGERLFGAGNTVWTVATTFNGAALMADAPFLTD